MFVCIFGCMFVFIFVSRSSSRIWTVRQTEIICYPSQAITWRGSWCRSCADAPPSAPLCLRSNHLVRIVVPIMCRCTAIGTTPYLSYYPGKYTCRGHANLLCIFPITNILLCIVPISGSKVATPFPRATSPLFGCDPAIRLRPVLSFVLRRVSIPVGHYRGSADSKI